MKLPQANPHDRRNTPSSLGAIISNDPLLREIVSTAQKIKRIKAVLLDNYPDTMITKLRVGSYRGGILTLICDNASVATQIRLKSKQLLHRLSAEQELETIHNIQCHVKKG